MPKTAEPRHRPPPNASAKRLKNEVRFLRQLSHNFARGDALSLVEAHNLAKLAGHPDADSARDLRDWFKEQVELLWATDPIDGFLVAQDKAISSKLTPLVETTARLKSLLRAIDDETAAAIEKVYAEAGGAHQCASASTRGGGRRVRLRHRDDRPRDRRRQRPRGRPRARARQRPAKGRAHRCRAVGRRAACRRGGEQWVQERSRPGE